MNYVNDTISSVIVPFANLLNDYKFNGSKSILGDNEKCNIFTHSIYKAFLSINDSKSVRRMIIIGKHKYDKFLSGDENAFYEYSGDLPYIDDIYQLNFIISEILEYYSGLGYELDPIFDEVPLTHPFDEIKSKWVTI